MNTDNNHKGLSLQHIGQQDTTAVRPMTVVHPIESRFADQEAKGETSQACHLPTWNAVLAFALSVVQVGWTASLTKNYS
ncbi:hypothetical protein [Mucilaginibacter sp. SP1R1]|uniref:hypothetical protein n=1 Tax=Mucilaginibacter sp. SP1R1 TaxID=2723091 RepID=UPI00160BB141|nr:hypothetical protein [Mucilaginibacter sp. SP1R1]MBB6147995.1 hypothetical protein [Mucilaginibacter sp. SP1R1]